MTRMDTTMTGLLQMLKEQLQQQQDLNSFPPLVWVVVVNEELSAPLIRWFDNPVTLADFLQPLVGKPGFVFVLKGQRAHISVGALPVLYLPGEIVPLFSVPSPVINVDGSMVPPHVPPVIPATPVIEEPDDDDEEEVEETSPSPVEAVAEPVVLVVVPGDETPSPAEATPVEGDEEEPRLF